MIEGPRGEFGHRNVGRVRAVKCLRDPRGHDGRVYLGRLALRSGRGPRPSGRRLRRSRAGRPGLHGLRSSGRDHGCGGAGDQPRAAILRHRRPARQAIGADPADHDLADCSRQLPRRGPVVLHEQCRRARPHAAGHPAQQLQGRASRVPGLDAAVVRDLVGRVGDDDRHTAQRRHCDLSHRSGRHTLRHVRLHAGRAQRGGGRHPLCGACRLASDSRPRRTLQGRRRPVPHRGLRHGDQGPAWLGVCRRAGADHRAAVRERGHGHGDPPRQAPPARAGRSGAPVAGRYPDPGRRPGRAAAADRRCQARGARRAGHPARSAAFRRHPPGRGRGHAERADRRALDARACACTTVMASTCWRSRARASLP